MLSKQELHTIEKRTVQVTAHTHDIEALSDSALVKRFWEVFASYKGVVAGYNGHSPRHFERSDKQDMKTLRKYEMMVKLFPVYRDTIGKLREELDARTNTVNTEILEDIDRQIDEVVTWEETIVKEYAQVANPRSPEN